ncbi:MAG: AAA family ATPase [Anaerolineae bacterium]|nr:AAA family ATPase [Anaerolineae bacterium]
MQKTDDILKRLLGKVVESEDLANLEEAAALLSQHWDEIPGIRREFYTELGDLLHSKAVDLKAVNELIKEKGWILSGSFILRAQVRAFIQSGKAKTLIRDLIGDGQVPDASKIDSFIDKAVPLAFTSKKGVRNKAGAALFASVLLTTVFPDVFVDFRQDRWAAFARSFELEPVPENATYGEMLYWAGHIAKQFARAPTFRRYFGTDKPNWIVAGLVFMFTKDEGGREGDLNLVGLIHQARNELGDGRGEILGMEITPQTIWDVLKHHNPQVILQGPPGSGKTYLAEQVVKFVAMSEGGNACRLAELQDGPVPTECSILWDIVQFHPSYSYEDFVRGLVTKATEQGILFQVQDRILAQAARAAGDHKIPVILVLDEINRADLARVLGELIYALERDRRGQPISSQYAVGDPPDHTLTLPPNLYLIGTMNTADRSIALVDYAIRRRFSFFSVLPSVQVVNAFYEHAGSHNGSSKVAAQLGPKVEALYQAVYDLFDGASDADDIRIGHSYFLIKGTRNKAKLSLEDWSAAIAFRFAFEVVPMLYEYRKERRLVDGADMIQVDDTSFSLHLSRQNETWAAVQEWLAQE